MSYRYSSFIFHAQELSPTTDSNLVSSLMNLIETLIDDYYDEAKLKWVKEPERLSQIEVRLFPFDIIAFIEKR